MWAILLAHVFFNVAVVVRVVGGFWATLDGRLWDAASTLGAGPVVRARRVTLPVLAPALASASAIVFLFCFTSFGVILILGGPQYRTLEVAVYENAVRLFDLPAAAALALLQLVAVDRDPLRHEPPGASNGSGATLGPRGRPGREAANGSESSPRSSFPSCSPSSRSPSSSSVRSGHPTGTAWTGSVRSATRRRRSSSHPGDRDELARFRGRRDGDRAAGGFCTRCRLSRRGGAGRTGS